MTHMAKCVNAPNMGLSIRQIVIANNMSPPQRFTFVSDPTDEYPDNKNNSFKVRLPTRLNLPGDNRYVSLWSVSVLDEAFSNNTVLNDPQAQVVDFAFNIYRLSNFDQASRKSATYQ